MGWMSLPWYYMVLGVTALSLILLTYYNMITEGPDECTQIYTSEYIINNKQTKFLF